MTNIYVIRHAEAEGNVFRRIDGHYNSRITANGKRQVEALKRRFADIPIDAVYASDLFRTCETAKAIYLPKNLPLHKDAHFRETYFGPWEDLHFGWLERFEPEQYGNFSHHPEFWRTPGAERADEYSGRFIEGLTEIAQNHDGQTVAVFTHGCISGEALRRLFGEDARKAGRCDNSGVSLLHYDSGKFTFSYLNDNSHLTKEISTLAHQLWWRGKHEFNMWFRDASYADTSLFGAACAPVSGETLKVAMLADRPAGYVSFKIDGETVCLTSMYLLPEFRHVRRGDQLLGIPVVEGRAAGCRRLFAAVPEDASEAIAFFRRFGADKAINNRMIHFSMEIDIPQY